MTDIPQADNREMIIDRRLASALLTNEGDSWSRSPWLFRDDGQISANPSQVLPKWEASQSSVPSQWYH